MMLQSHIHIALILIMMLIMIMMLRVGMMWFWAFVIHRHRNRGVIIRITVIKMCGMRIRMSHNMCRRLLLLVGMIGQHG